jgi:surface protein
MFSGCVSLKSVPDFDTSKVTTMATMFNACTALIYSGNLNAAAVATAATNMFSSCSSLSKGLLIGMRRTVSFTGTLLNRTALESIFDNLGSGISATITISNTPGAAGGVAADQSFSRSSTRTAGSTTITVLVTSLTTGMQVVGVGSPLTTAAAVTTTAATSLITRTAHGLENGDEVSFATIVTTTGITTNTIYYVINKTADDFQISTSVGGSALTFTNDGSGTIRYRTEIVSIGAGTVTVSRPMTSSGTGTLVYRNLKTGTALLKGFAVTG